MNDPRSTAQRSTADRGTGAPASPASQTPTQRQIADAIQDLVRVRYGRHLPTNVRLPSARQLDALILGAVSTATQQLRRHAAIAPAVPETLDVLLLQARPLVAMASTRIVASANAHPELIHYVLWYANQRAHSFEVEKAFLNGFFDELVKATERRSVQVWAQRSLPNIAAHVAVASQSPNPIFVPVFFLFLYGTGFAIVRDTTETIGMLKRYWDDPARMCLDFLLMLLWLCSFAFDSTESAREAARTLARGMASDIVDSVSSAIFPDPTDPSGDGAYLFTETGQDFIRSAPDLVKDLASLVMVPFALGALAGPLLLDLVFTLLSIFFPQVSFAAILARSPRVAQLINLARQAIPDLAARQRRIPNPFDDGADAPAMPVRSQRGAGDRGLEREAPAAAGSVPAVAAPSPPTPIPATPQPPSPQRGRLADMTPEQRRDWRIRRVLRSVDQFVQRYGARLSTDPQTRQALDGMFGHSSSVTRGGARQTFQQSRAIASGELRTLVNFLRDPEVEMVQLIPGRPGSRTPDMVVRYTNGITIRAEVRTITAARRGQRPHSGTVPEHVDIGREAIRDAVRDKIMPQGRVSQLEAVGQGLPDGGSLELVIHDPTRFDVVTATREALDDLAPQLSKARYTFFQRVRVTYLIRGAPGEVRRRAFATFARQSDGSYRHVP